MSLKDGGKTRYWWFTPVILATQEAKIGRITIPGQHGKKFSRPYINRKKLGVVVHYSHTSYSGQPKIGRLRSRQAWEKSKTLSPE
jgi:hypothetical protein